jgi:hypothetical protein
VEHNAKAFYKLITSLHCKCYRLIHPQDSYAHGGKQRTARREGENRKLVKLLKRPCSKYTRFNPKLLEISFAYVLETVRATELFLTP